MRWFLAAFSTEYVDGINGRRVVLQFRGVDSFGEDATENKFSLVNVAIHFFYKCSSEPESRGSIKIEDLPPLKTALQKNEDSLWELRKHVRIFAEMAQSYGSENLPFWRSKHVDDILKESGPPTKLFGRDCGLEGVRNQAAQGNRPGSPFPSTGPGATPTETTSPIGLWERGVCAAPIVIWDDSTSD
ncbi:unnamed protein product [Amoebophrya sp. A120]|nr:unnamed protein product [Amoebophrya sp. A120]|eukprot:GSA120T00007950001.1